MEQKRIWELDALRGVCVLGMIAVHGAYDLMAASGLKPGGLFLFVMDWGGVAFLLLSGVCATLGSRPARRGLTVLGCGLAVSAVTAGMYALGLADRAILIYFGVLHCLGLSMILWHPLRRLPTPALAALGLALTAAGVWLRQLRGQGLWLVWLGLIPRGFATSDYFPMLPFFGFFLLGAALGRCLYKTKTSLLPGLGGGAAARGLQWLGRWSLPVYLLHQPILTGILSLILL